MRKRPDTSLSKERNDSKFLILVEDLLIYDVLVRRKLV